MRIWGNLPIPSTESQVQEHKDLNLGRDSVGRNENRKTGKNCALSARQKPKNNDKNKKQRAKKRPHPI
jgi:hypothetical protein